MTNDDLREILSEHYDEETLDEIVLFENPDYADAVVGISHDDRVIYSYDKMIEHLMQVDGMTEEEAAEFIDFNTLRSLPYARSYGANTPIIMYDAPIRFFEQFCCPLTPKKGEKDDESEDPEKS